MTTVDAMADEIMKGLTDYADLADEAMKKTVRKTAKSVKDEISANAPKRTGAYSKSCTPFSSAGAMCGLPDTRPPPRLAWPFSNKCAS